MAVEPRHGSGQPEDFLLGGAVPDLATLVKHRLTAYAYTCVPDNHAEHASLRRGFLTAARRHLRVKAKVLRLVGAWRQAGVDVLLFKGFYLAEFVYPVAAQRPYGDVDVVVKPEHSAEARLIARDLGWHEVWAREDSLYTHNHEEARLDLPGEFRLEVHRLVLDSHSPFNRVQRRFTRAAWEGSSEVDWQGTTVRVLRPVDSVLMGLVLNRSWSCGDNWRLRAHDFLDFRYLVDASGITREALVRRAQELGCTRTLQLFLNRCDPWRGRLNLTEPSTWQRQRWKLAVTPERGNLDVERMATDVYTKLPWIVGGLRYLPEVFKVRGLMNRLGNVGSVLAALDDVPGHGLADRCLREEEQIAIGIKWCSKLLWPLQKDRCLARSLALYAAYRRRGFSVTFHAGHEDHHAGEQHAWVELYGRRLADLLNLENCPVRAVTVRHPAVTGLVPYHDNARVGNGRREASTAESREHEI